MQRPAVVNETDAHGSEVIAAMKSARTGGSPLTPSFRKTQILEATCQSRFDIELLIG